MNAIQRVDAWTLSAIQDITVQEQGVYSPGGHRVRMPDALDEFADVIIQYDLLRETGGTYQK